VLPWVSFIIPVRDDAIRLSRCLDSIRRSDYPRELIEVIVVVDNASRDDSAQVARDRGAIVLRSDGCVAELRNRGAQAALGGILAFVDSDRELDDPWIPTVVDMLSGRVVAAVGSESGNLAVSRETFDTLGGFDRSLEASEDIDFCNRLRLAGRTISQTAA
jgi:glycosyltransferase involved in cell wall biosynthesis